MRDSALSRKNVVSRRQYDETTMLYTTALNDKEKASLDLVRAQQVHDACFIWTPFNAVVTEVYRFGRGIGRCRGSRPENQYDRPRQDHDYLPPGGVGSIFRRDPHSCLSAGSERAGDRME